MINTASLLTLRVFGTTMASSGSGAKENRAGEKRAFQSKQIHGSGQGRHGGSRQGDASLRRTKARRGIGTASNHNGKRGSSSLRAKVPAASEQRKEQSPPPPLASLPGSGGKFSGINVSMHGTGEVTSLVQSLCDKSLQLLLPF